MESPHCTDHDLTEFLCKTLALFSHPSSSAYDNILQYPCIILTTQLAGKNLIINLNVKLNLVSMVWLAAVDK